MNFNDNYSHDSPDMPNIPEPQQNTIETLNEPILESNDEVEQTQFVKKRPDKTQLLKNLKQKINTMQTDINHNTNTNTSTISNLNNDVVISQEDLVLILNLLIIINKRGAFILEEFKTVGELYSKLIKLKK